MGQRGQGKGRKRRGGGNGNREQDGRGRAERGRGGEGAPPPPGAGCHARQGSGRMAPGGPSLPGRRVPRWDQKSDSSPANERETAQKMRAVTEGKRGRRRDPGASPSRQPHEHPWGGTPPTPRPPPQVLDVAEQPGGIAAQLRPLHRLAAAPALPLPRHLRPAGRAALRGPVRLRGHGGSAQQLRQLPAGPHQRLPGGPPPGPEAASRSSAAGRAPPPPGSLLGSAGGRPRALCRLPQPLWLSPPRRCSSDSPTPLSEGLCPAGPACPPLVPGRVLPPGGEQPGSEGRWGGCPVPLLPLGARPDRAGLPPHGWGRPRSTHRLPLRRHAQPARTGSRPRERDWGAPSGRWGRCPVQTKALPSAARAL